MDDTRRFRGYVACLMMASALVLSGCDQSRRQYAQDHATAATVYCLTHVCESVLMISEREDLFGPPPTSLPSLVGWLQKGGGAASLVHNGTIRDGWGNDIVLLVTPAGKLWAVGSAGSDKTWEGGRGDDLVFSLEEVKNGVAVQNWLSRHAK